MTGLLTINHTNDNQILLTSPSSWTGIGFNDSGGNGTQYIWHNGIHGTFAIGGGGSNVANKKLHVDGGMTIGSSYDTTAVTANSLNVQGTVTATGGNSTNWNTAYTVANAALPKAGGTITGNLNVNGTTTLGNGNADQTHINDTLYLGATDSGDSHFYFGENSSNWYGDHWYWDSGYEVERYSRFAGTDSLIEKHDTRYTHKVQTNRAYERLAHSTGYQIGSYNSVGDNSGKTNPIYVIGDNYRPTDTSVSGMYGIGYAHSNLWGTSNGKPSAWGHYVVEGGQYIHVTTNGGTWSLGEFNRNGNKVWDAGNDGAGSGLDADLLDGQHGSYYYSKTNMDAGRNIVSGTDLDTDLANGGAFSSYGSGGTSWNAPFSYGGVLGWSFTSGIEGQIGFDIRHNQSAYSDFWFRGKNNLGFNPWSKVWHTLNDGSGSGLDADLLDGVHGASFLRSDAADTGSGKITLTATEGLEVGGIRGRAIGNQSGDFIQLYERVNIGYPSGWGASGANAPTQGLSTHGGAQFNVGNVSGAPLTFNGNAIWHAGNDGSGSTLDADLLDGKDSILFPRYRSIFGTGSNKNWNTEIADVGGTGRMHWDEVHNISTSWTNGPIATFSSAYTYGGVQSVYLGSQKYQMYVPHLASNGNGVYYRSGWGASQWYDWRVFLDSGNVSSYAWTSSNDGAGSGLDADLLDGQQGSYYYQASNPTGYLIGSGSIAESHRVSGNAFATAASSPGSALEYQQAASQTDTKLAPSTDWYNSIRMGHGNPYSYYSNTMAMKMTGTGSGTLYTQVISNNSAGGWNKYWHTNNDGSGSGLDADLLDGQQGSYYFQSSVSDQEEAYHLDIRDSRAAMVTPDGEDDKRISAHFTNQIPGYGDWRSAITLKGWTDGYYAWQIHGPSSTGNPNSGLYYRDGKGSTWNSSYEIWHAGRDGSGSGLDADLLDGQHGSYYAPASSYLPLAGGTMTGTLDLGTTSIAVDSDKGFVNSGPWTRNTTPYGYIALGPANTSHAHIYTNLSNFYFNVNTLYQNGNLIWGANNDGSGSGLDADTVDSLHASSFWRSDTSNNGAIRFDTTEYDFTSAYNPSQQGVPNSIRLWDHYTQTNAPASYGQLLDLYGRSGHWRHQFHMLNTDLRFRYGTYPLSTAGWSSWYTQWHSGNDGSGSGLDADLLDGYNAEETAVNNSIVKRDGTATIKVNGVYLGGTGAANKLDDYEEGTWTPTSSVVTSLGINFAKYTKIGMQVTVVCQFYGKPDKNENNYDTYRIGGLPFQPNADAVGGVGKCGGQYFYAHNAVARSGTNYIEFYTQGSQNSPSVDNDVYYNQDHYDYGNNYTQSNLANDHVDITITYLTDQ